MYNSMGKILIIKGANFSENAVEKIAKEPEEYYELAGFGSSANFAEGDYYINSNYRDRFYKKTAEGTTAITEGTAFVKYREKGYYMYFDASIETIKFLPGYGLEVVDPEVMKGIVTRVTEGAIVLAESGGYNTYKVVIKNGESVTWATAGSSTVAVAVEKSDGSAEILSASSNIGNIVYTNNTGEDVTIFMNNTISLATNVWIAKVLN